MAIPADVPTVGALRAILEGLPADDPVMVAVDGHSAAWARRVVVDQDARSVDILAGRLPDE